MSETVEILKLLAERGRWFWFLPAALAVALWYIVGWIFGTVQKFFELTHRETVFHWAFWGTSLIALLVLSVAVFAVWWRFVRTPPLPENELVVTVAQFTPVSSGAADDASNQTDYVYRALLAKKDAGAPLAAKKAERGVEDGDAKKRQHAAERIGTSRNGNAHFVIWGDVRKDENELMVVDRIADMGRWSGFRLDDGGRDDTHRGPKHIEFKERRASNVADLVTFVSGLAFLRAGQWAVAAKLFAASGSPPAHFFKGVALHRLSLTAPDPVPPPCFGGGSVRPQSATSVKRIVR